MAWRENDQKLAFLKTEADSFTCSKYGTLLKWMTKNVKEDKNHFKLLVYLKTMSYWTLFMKETEARSPG